MLNLSLNLSVHVMKHFQQKVGPKISFKATTIYIYIIIQELYFIGRQHSYIRIEDFFLALTFARS